MSMFNDISCDRKGNKDECLANAGVVKVLARRFDVGQCSLIGPGSEKKWYSVEENSPQGAWDHIADEMLLEFAEKPISYFPCNDLHYPEVFSRAKDMENCQYTSLGAVANICEEFEAHQDRSGELDVLMCQSIVLEEIKAEILLQNENSMNHQILWQQYIERIESLSPESKVSRFCKEAGFMRIVEVGQYNHDQGHL